MFWVYIHWEYFALSARGSNLDVRIWRLFNLGLAVDQATRSAYRSALSRPNLRHVCSKDVVHTFLCGPICGWNLQFTSRWGYFNSHTTGPDYIRFFIFFIHTSGTAFKTCERSNVTSISNIWKYLTHICQIWIIFTQLKLWISSAHADILWKESS